MSAQPLLEHPGELCTSGQRAVDLALAGGTMRLRLAAAELVCQRLEAGNLPGEHAAAALRHALSGPLDQAGSA